MASSFYHGWDTLHLNWFTGCEPGLPCWQRCWARAMASRLKGRSGYPADEPFRPTFHDKAFARPLPKKPQVIALNFMGDWALASRSVLTDMLMMMATYPQHTFLTLTKRAHLLEAKMLPTFPDNLWLGLSASDDDYRAKWDELNSIPAAHTWIFFEPLLAEATLPLPLPDWVVVGCESGRGARWGDLRCGHFDDEACDPDACGCETTPNECWHAFYEVDDWTRSIVDQCRAAGVPVMVKQLPVFIDFRDSGWKEGKWVVSSDLADFPADLRVAERPERSEK